MGVIVYDWWIGLRPQSWTWRWCWMKSWKIAKVIAVYSDEEHISTKFNDNPSVASFTQPSLLPSSYIFC